MTFVPSGLQVNLLYGLDRLPNDFTKIGSPPTRTPSVSRLGRAFGTTIPSPSHPVSVTPLGGHCADCGGGSDGETDWSCSRRLFTHLFYLLALSGGDGHRGSRGRSKERIRCTLVFESFPSSTFLVNSFSHSLYYRGQVRTRGQVPTVSAEDSVLQDV